MFRIRSSRCFPSLLAYTPGELSGFGLAEDWSFFFGFGLLADGYDSEGFQVYFFCMANES